MKNVVIGGQYGDEGKGKIVSYLAVNDDPEIIARGGVGPNAGHEVHHKGEEYPMRMLSCGFVNPNARILIGAGVFVNPDVFLEEVEKLEVEDRVGVDPKAGLITQEHIKRDKESSLSEKIETTKTGCGPAVTDRAKRSAKTVADIEKLEPYFVDVAKEVNSAKDVIIEGSQGFMLSNVFGTYPYVTSKDVSAGTVARDVGLGPTNVDETIMVVKAYTTRVGAGPLPKEIEEKKAKKMGIQEYGTVTGRPRRTSDKLHFEDIRRAAMVNGATQIALTKVDIKFEENKGVQKFSNLTPEAQEFVNDVEEKIGVPIKLIGTGPETQEVIDRR